MPEPAPPPTIDRALAALLARPGTHLHEVAALDHLGTVLRTAPPGSLVLLYGATGAEADAVAEAAGEIYLADRAATMAEDARILPLAVVDAAFDPKGVLDLRFLFADLMARVGAAPVGIQLPRTRTPAETAVWARGRRQQLRETADFHLGAVAACHGRDVEVVVVRHLERSGQRGQVAARGAGTETLVQFAAAAGVILVLSGGYEVLDYRTTAAAFEEVRVRRYDPGLDDDVAEFGRVVTDELADFLGADLASDNRTVRDLMAQTLGSVALLRAWSQRARALRGARGAACDPLAALDDTAPMSLHQLKAAAVRIRASEARLAAEAGVTVDEVLALLSGSEPDEVVGEQGATVTTKRARRHPDGLRPGERGLVDDQVGQTSADAA